MDWMSEFAVMPPPHGGSVRFIRAGIIYSVSQQASIATTDDREWMGLFSCRHLSIALLEKRVSAVLRRKLKLAVSSFQ